MADLADIADRVVGSGASEGEEVEAYVARGITTTVRAYDGEVESVTSAESSGAGLRVISGRRQGFAHAGSLDEGIVSETLDEARDNSCFGEVDEYLGLARPDGIDFVPQELWNPAVVEFPYDNKLDLALELEKLARAQDPRIRGVRTAVYSDSAVEAAISTTTGIRREAESTHCSVSVQVLASDDDETQTGVGVDVGRDPAGLDLAKAAGEASERALRLLGAMKPPSRRVQMVLEPRLSAMLLGIVGGMLSGEMVLKGRSPFGGRVGEQIAAAALSFVDDPTDPESLGADEFDGEGLACRATPLIAGGVLNGYLQNSYTGRRSGSGSTASAVRGFRSTPGVGTRALRMTAGDRDVDDILAGIDDGLYVQSLQGIHSGVNPVSGDFSVGATGLLICDGELAEPVREVTLASTIQRMLLDISEVGSDFEWRPGGTGAATLVIDDVSMSGTRGH